MKKRLIACLMTALLFISASIGAYATDSFNLRVFHGEDDITVSSPTSDGDIIILVDSLGKHGNGTFGINEGAITFIPMVIASQKYDLFCVTIEYCSLEEASIDEIDFLIGDNFYRFGKVEEKNRWDSELKCYDETMMFLLDRNSIEFMEDLEVHNQESIVTNFINKNQNITFELPDDVKSGLTHLYGLYKSAGGTNQNNLDMVWLSSGSKTYKKQVIS